MKRGKLELAVGRALRATPLQASDGAIEELVRSYARKIDSDDRALLLLGRQFTEALVQLGMTPKARAAVKGAVPPVSSGLDEIRARRERHA